MDLIFVTEGRFLKRSNGNIYSIDGGYSNTLWKRYLSIFDRITVMARVLHDDQCAVNENYLATNDKVSFIELPYYLGPFQYLKVRRQLQLIIKNNIKTNVAYICRVPGTIGKEVSSLLRKRNIPYAVEVVGDPYDVFAPGTLNHPLRPYLRYSSTIDLKKIVYGSRAAIYVTEKALQKRYTTKGDCFTTNASDVNIKDKDIVSTPKVLVYKDTYDIISIGSLAQMYKAPDVVIKALSLLKGQGINCKLTWLGDGYYKKSLINLASQLGIQNHVNFIGNVTAEEVKNNLLKSDIFVLASRTEGLPRAVIEAMACGIPCIGTKVGGIPELLENSALIESNNPVQLAEKIKLMITDLYFTNNQAMRNLRESHKYKDSTLSTRRLMFYTKIINLSKI